MIDTTPTKADRQAPTAQRDRTRPGRKGAIAKIPIVTQPIAASAAHAARMAIGSGALFAVLLLSLHVLEPEFDPTWRFVSEYMLGRFGWMMHLAFLSLATSIASAGVAIVSQVRTWPGYIGLALLGIAAIGLLVAAIFPTDPAITSRSPETMTLSGTMHVFGASLDYTPVAALLVSWSLGRNAAWSPIRGRLLLTAAITLVVTAVFIAALPYDGTIAPGVLAGLVGRFLLLSYLGWIVVVGRHALMLHDQTQTVR